MNQETQFAKMVGAMLVHQMETSTEILSIVRESGIDPDGHAVKRLSAINDKLLASLDDSLLGDVSRKYPTEDGNKLLATIEDAKKRVESAE